MTPEFSRMLPIGQIGPAGADIIVEANDEERAALATRLKLPAVRSLSCRFRLRRAEGNAIAAEGWLAALVSQSCVVSLDDFDAAVTDHFTLRFVPEGTKSFDIDPDSEDDVPYSNNVVDLGEAATVQLALTLDPWPRKPDAALPEPGANDAPTSPFAALAHPRRPS